MKLAWLTDIHLNFLKPPARIKFYNSIPKDCDAVIITGDIAEADDLEAKLMEMESQLKRPIYFVLGNHDFYGSSIATVKKNMNLLCYGHKNLRWAPESIYRLTGDTWLVGADTWADGRLGDFHNSDVVMNDWLQIAELRGAYYSVGSGYYRTRREKNPLLEVIQREADSAATDLRWQLSMAVNHNATRIIVLSHVPPFKEVSLYDRHISDGNHLPFYASKVVGDLLLEVATANPEIQFDVYCGHTHHVAEYIPLPNLVVRVQQAEYRHPTFVEIELD